MVHLDYRDARPIYAQIFQGLRQQIRSGVLLPGDKLPSVRELAAALSINPNTIQRAYQQLEQEGWIASVSGKGSFVTGTPAGSDGELMAEFDRLCDKLMAVGVSRDALIQRLIQGGNHHA